MDISNSSDNLENSTISVDDLLEAANGLTITSYLPTPNIIVLSGVYIVFTALGLLGNGVVITMIVRVLWSRRMVLNVYVYVLCLSAVDFVFLATGPMTIAFMLHGNWTFGTVLCKIAFFCEGLNKSMSIYLLVILSADRYLAVCKPTTSARYRSIKAASIALLILFTCVLITNVPIYKYASVVSRAMDNESGIAYCGMLFPKLNETGSDNDPWNHFGSYYTLTLISCYYVAPAALICFFYVQILGRLKEQYKALRKRSSSSRRLKVTMSILSVIAFYFICWSPYWLLQMIIQFFPHVTMASEEAQVVFLYLATSIYTLPYVNSSIDPILYAFLNKRLRKAYAATSKRMMRKVDRNNVEITVEESQHSIRLFSMHTVSSASRSPVPVQRLITVEDETPSSTAFLMIDQRSLSKHILTDEPM